MGRDIHVLHCIIGTRRSTKKLKPHFMKRIIFITSLFLGATQFLFSQTYREILPDLNEPNDLILVGDELYYIERTRINKVNVTDPTFAVQNIATGIKRGAGIAIKDNYLYATDFDRGTILKIDISNSQYNSEVLIDSLQTPDMMAINGDILYYTDPNAQIIGRVNLVNDNPRMPPLLRNAGRTIGIAIYEDGLYYTDQQSRTVKRIDLSAPIPTSQVIFADLVRPQGLSKCGSEIYISDDEGFSIWKFNPSCTPDELELVLDGVDSPRQTSIGNNFLYTMTVQTENIARLAFRNSACYVDKHVICASDTLTWLDGNMYTTSNNTASVTLQNSDGCDSIVVLNLTINETNAGVTTAGGTLTATETDATYQWLNCRDGLGPIFGATSPSYTPNIPGSFAVEITKNGCVDTSDCFRVSISTSTNDVSVDAPFEIYPNPTSEILTVDFEETSAGTIEVFTLTGQLVNQYVIEDSRSFDFALTEQAGVYLLRVQLGDLSWTERIMKL